MKPDVFGRASLMFPAFSLMMLAACIVKFSSDQLESRNLDRVRKKVGKSQNLVFPMTPNFLILDSDIKIDSTSS